MIKVNHLTKRYRDFCLSMDLEIPEGCITGLVGKNGAGKSTTIKAILGLTKPDGGSATVFGTYCTKLGKEEKNKIGVALAEAGFSPYLSINDIIKILRKSYQTFEEDEFLSLCQRMQLPLNKKVKEFSTGMKAKLRVIVAITHQAKLLIMDEPTAGLDVEARGEVLDMIREYMEKDETRSVLITSHISGDLESICDDIYLIHNGEVILHEDTDVILSSYGIIKVDEEHYQKLDQRYLLRTKKESFGYSCYTNEKQYYLENYPGIVIENGSIDDLILMMTGGAK